jgi:cell division protein FtsB
VTPPVDVAQLQKQNALLLRALARLTAERDALKKQIETLQREQQAVTR